MVAVNAHAAASPGTPEDVRALIASTSCVRIVGAGTKTHAAAPPDALTVSLRSLSGILDYEPNEYTFTALAGTPLREVQAILEAHGQMLPFDPPLAQRGATLGGTVATGLSGPGRYRNGGIRDFILGVRFVDGDGRLVRGGGNVVKNAAGFDFPKLMVGSLGQLGALVDVTFKVFPRPEARATLRLTVSDLDNALDVVRRLSRSTWDVAALDIVADQVHTIVDIRLAGLESALASRIDGVRAFLGDGERMTGEADDAVWGDAAEFRWLPQGFRLMKVPMTPGRVGGFEAAIASRCPVRRYAAGAQVAWVAWPSEQNLPVDELVELGLSGQIVLGPGPGDSVVFGALDGGAFAARMKRALDPDGRFR